jgi:hypothetical protein
MCRGRLVTIAAIAVLMASAAGGSDALAAPSDFDEAAAQAEPTSAPAEDRVIARVTGVHGRVYAEAPDGERRLLVENGPIYPGDRLVTERGAQLGVLSGDHYTGLNEDTELSYALTPGGAPEVRLVRGQVRVIEASDASGAAQVSAPSLQVAAASGDVEVYAFPEKAYLVSMVCALEGQVQAAGLGGQSATVAEGGCAISKPAEAIYAAGAAGGEPLPVVSAAGPPPSPIGPASQRFPAPGPDVARPLASFAEAPTFALDDPTLYVPCGTGATGSCGAAPPPTNPPTNPPVPGPLPPFPTVPPTNPPVPGPLPPFP